MAQQVINGPDSPHMVPHAQEPNAERGDKWKTIIDAINANFDELYAGGTETSVNVGAAEAGVSVVEHGNATSHRTVLTLADFAVGDSADNAALALGALLYTFPAGVIVVRSATINVGVTIADAVQTDTPEIGLGTLVGSGANATLGAVDAAAENIFEGTAMADVAGTAFVGSKATTLVIEAADDHTVHLNLADTWADLTAEAALTADGTITIVWDFLG